jgi:quercetin dioxygenase-like cupin family protein
MKSPMVERSRDFPPLLFLALLSTMVVAAAILSGGPGRPMLGLPMMSMAPGAIAGGEPMQMAGRTAGIKSTVVSQEKLSHVAGKTVTVEVVEFPPLAFAPEHHHAGSVTVYVLSGVVRSQIAGEPAMDFHAGQSFFEPPGAIHMFAENPSATEPAKFMAIHIADDGAQLTTYH